MRKFMHQSKHLGILGIPTIDKDKRSIIIYQSEATTLFYSYRSLIIKTDYAIIAYDYTQVFYRLCQESQSIIHLAIFHHPVDRQAQNSAHRRTYLINAIFHTMNSHKRNFGKITLMEITTQPLLTFLQLIDRIIDIDVELVINSAEQRYRHRLDRRGW